MRSLVRSIIIFLSIFLVGVQAQPAPWGERALSLKPFSALDSQYISDIEIVGGEGEAAVTISGNPALLPYVKAEVKNDILYLKAPRGVHVLIRTSQLKRISVVGEGHVRGKSLGILGPLTVNAAGEVDLSIQGPVDLASVVTSGEAKFRAWWVDAQDLHVTSSGKSKIMMTGRTFRVTAALFDQSKFDASRLRSKQVIVQTNNRALAKVMPIEGLTAYAASGSRVEYFKEPRRLTHFSGKYGNVLKMANYE